MFAAAYVSLSAIGVDDLDRVLVRRAVAARAEVDLERTAWSGRLFVGTVIIGPAPSPVGFGAEPSYAAARDLAQRPR